MDRHKLLLFQTDFGRLEGTVAEMYGVALGVDQGLKIHEITHYIPQFNIWEASYRLMQALPWWPKETGLLSIILSNRVELITDPESGQYLKISLPAREARIALTNVVAEGDPTIAPVLTLDRTGEAQD